MATGERQENVGHRLMRVGANFTLQILRDHGRGQECHKNKWKKIRTLKQLHHAAQYCIFI